MKKRFLKYSLLILTSVFVLNINHALAEKYFIMPEVLGLSKKEAINKINAVCGDITVTLYTNKIHDETMTNGSVRTIEPAAGSKITPNTKLYMTIAENNLTSSPISTAPATQNYSGTFVMPEVAGLTEQQAKDKLNQVSGNIPVSLYVSKTPTDKVPNGIVLKIKPAPGSKVKSGTLLVLDVAENDFTAETLKTYPNVINMTMEKAKKTLMNAGFPEYKISCIYNENPYKQVADNTVIDSLINANGNIKLTVYKKNLVSMPSVVGKSYKEAEKILQDTGIFKTIKREEVLYSADFIKKYPSRAREINTIVKQFPSAGARINPDVGNYAWLSEGVTEAEQTVEVPIIGQDTEKNALAKLKNRGLVPKITYVKTSSSATGGRAAVKTEPKAGTKVKKGTVVKITVYLYKPKVPFMFQYTKDEAIKMLTDVGLKYEFDYESTFLKGNNNKVAKTSPAKHTQVDPGTVVKVTLYRFDKVKVPNLVHMTKDKAIAYMKEYKSDIKYEFKDKLTVYTTKVGKIYKTSPEYTTVVKPGDTIIIYIYKLLDAVPDVLGKTEEQATAELKDFGFAVKTIYEEIWDENQKIGTVIKQGQKAGKPAAGPVIYIYVVREPDKVRIPDVIGKSLESAVYTVVLADSGFKPVVERVKIFDRKKHDRVVATFPGAGAKVKPGSELALRVGQLVEYVPDVVGLTESEAKRKLRYAGFYSTVLYIKDGIPGKVVNQSPDANSTPTNGKVNLYIAQPQVKLNLPTQRDTDYIVPHVASLTINEARQRLAEVNLNYKINYVQTGRNRQGIVLGTHPPAGVKLKPEWKQYVVLNVGMYPYSVPDVVGMTKSHALKVLNTHNLYPRIIEDRPPRNWNRKKQPIVLNQEPHGGAPKRAPYVQLRLIYEAHVPTVEGMSLAEAVSRLQSWSLKYKIKFVPVAEGKYDRVVQNAYPYPGTKVPLGETITLKVGKVTDAVPNVIGMSENEAVKILGNLNIHVIKEYKDSDTTNNVVLAQSLIAGTNKAQGSITILLGTSSSLTSINKPTPAVKKPPLFPSGQATPTSAKSGELAGKATVPNFNNKSLPNKDIKELFELLNLKVEIKENETASRISADTIYRTVPAPKTKVNKGSTVIVYKYVLLKKVPDVVGKTEAQATQILENLGFAVRKLYTTDKTPGMVWKQSQKGGNPPLHAAITLGIGKTQAPPKPMASMRLSQPAENHTNEIREFYAKFKDAYEAKDEIQVVSLISGDWNSSDGNSIMELEENLYNMFSVFDEVVYSISGLSVQPDQNGLFRVSYNLAIKGTIFESGIEHTEKSSVQELVKVDSGKVSIIKTLSGNFWSMQ